MGVLVRSITAGFGALLSKRRFIPDARFIPNAVSRPNGPATSRPNGPSAPSAFLDPNAPLPPSALLPRVTQLARSALLRRVTPLAPSALFLLALALPTLAPNLLLAQAMDGYVLPTQSIQDAFATDPNYAILNNRSPDGDHFLVPHKTELSTLEALAKETYRLAELELRPKSNRLWHLDTYGIDGFEIYSLSQKRSRRVPLPAGAFASDFMWSPDGSQLAFLAHLREGTEAWVVDGDGRNPRSLSSVGILATIGTTARGQGNQPSRMVQWTASGEVVTLALPNDRGSEPTPGAVPSTPLIRRTRDSATPGPTYPNLLRTPHDAALFEYYTTSQLTVIASDGGMRSLGEPAMWESISVSPDGRYIMATRLTKPFSYITSYNGFPRVTEVLDMDGNVISTLNERALREGRGRRGPGGGGQGGGPRAWAWHPDGAVLTYLERSGAPEDAEEDPVHDLGDDPEEAAAESDTETPLDRIMIRIAPFGDSEAVVVAESEHRIQSAEFAKDGAHVFARLADGQKAATVFWMIATGSGPATVASPVTNWYEASDPLAHPGNLWTSRTGNGGSYVEVSDGGSVLLRGAGLRDDFRPRPFVDRVTLSDQATTTHPATTRIFEGASDSFDQPLTSLDAAGERIIVSREAVHDFPDSFLWEDGTWGSNLTQNEDPFPEFTAARRVDFDFERRDGLKIKGRISLPVDYVEGTKVPAIFWTYPREFRTKQAYERSTIRSRNLNAHTRMTWLRWSDMWLSQGYALIYPDIPIVGEDYNDYYISNMVDGMYAAVRAVEATGLIDIDRIGHGGHSYGAFATANFLAHTPFFKAGIAGDGAYNRSLTPMGFQAEPRDIWEAPNVYIEISPFFAADQINTPLLMYHGADDNNTGTFPVQSERLMQALTGLGKNAVLYMYPFESHTPRAIENNLDMWARWIEWFDRYVKNPTGTEPVTEDGTS